MTDPAPEIPAPRRPVTEDIILQVTAALETTKGHRGHAAKLLGMEEKRLNNIVYGNPGLRAKWSSKEERPVEPGPATDIHRPAPVAPFAKTEDQIASAVAAEDALWQKGVEKLNFTAEKKDFLTAVMGAHGNHWTATTHMFRGGVSYTATELLFMFHKIEAEIAETFSNPENFQRTAFSTTGKEYVVKDAHDYRLELVDRALTIAETFRKLNQDAERAQLLAAQVEKLRVGDAKTVKKRKQAAWKATTPQKPTTVETTP